MADFWIETITYIQLLVVKIAARACIIPTTRIWSTHLVALPAAATTTLSAIPTGVNSPDLENEDNTAWFIGYNGSVRCTFDYGYTSYGFL